MFNGLRGQGVFGSRGRRGEGTDAGGVNELCVLCSRGGGGQHPTPRAKQGKEGQGLGFTIESGAKAIQLLFSFCLGSFSSL